MENKQYVELKKLIKSGFKAVDKRFDCIDRRFEEVDQRFNGIDRRFEGVDQKFEGIDKKFQGVSKEFLGINKRLDNLEKGQELFAENFNTAFAALDRLEANKADRFEMSQMEERLREEALRNKDEILTALDAYAKRSDDQKQEHDVLVGQVDRHDRWLVKIAKKTDVKLDY